MTKSRFLLKTFAAPVMAAALLVSPAAGWAGETAVSAATVQAPSLYETQLNAYAVLITAQLDVLSETTTLIEQTEEDAALIELLTLLKKQLAAQNTPDAAAGKNAELVALHAKHRELLTLTSEAADLTLSFLKGSLTEAQFDAKLAAWEKKADQVIHAYTKLAEAYVKKYSIVMNPHVYYVFYEEDVSNERLVTYTVKKGDTLYKIASLYDTDVTHLKRMNSLSGNGLKIGQTLRFYTPLPASTPQTPPSALVYTVKKGDTLYKLAKQHGMSVSSLKALNNLTSNHIKVGQQLKVQKGASVPSPAPAPAYVTYQVKKGDTLYRIAKANGLSVPALKSLNNLSSNHLKVGQVLKVKKK